MTHADHAPTRSLNRLADDATTHCLTGCTIGDRLVERGLGHAKAMEHHGGH